MPVRADNAATVVADPPIAYSRPLAYAGPAAGFTRQSTPFVCPDGSRLHVAIPDVTRAHWAVNIRKCVVWARTLVDLVERDTVTPQAAESLDAAVVACLNVIVAGGTQAGKTTMLCCVLGSVPARERVVTCEEVIELAGER